VFDESETFAGRLNHEMVLLADLDLEDTQLVRHLLTLHIRRTGSARARWIFDGWEHQQGRWRKVKPRGAAAHVARIRGEWLARIETLVSEAVPVA